MQFIELQEEGMFQRRLEKNLCPKCNLPMKKNKTVQKCTVCLLVVENC
jgi:rubrerythrin